MLQTPRVTLQLGKRCCLLSGDRKREVRDSEHRRLRRGHKGEGGNSILRPLRKERGNADGGFSSRCCSWSGTCGCAGGRAGARRPARTPGPLLQTDPTSWRGCLNGCSLPAVSWLRGVDPPPGDVSFHPAPPRPAVSSKPTSLALLGSVTPSSQAITHFSASSSNTVVAYYAPGQDPTCHL